jgi:hypothetical protein
MKLVKIPLSAKDFWIHEAYSTIVIGVGTKNWGCNLKLDVVRRKTNIICNTRYDVSSEIQRLCRRIIR